MCIFSWRVKWFLLRILSKEGSIRVVEYVYWDLYRES